MQQSPLYEEKWKIATHAIPHSMGAISLSNSHHMVYFITSQQTHQRWINVEIWLKMKVEPTYVYWRCFNVDKTLLIELGWFNVDDSVLFQCWYYVEKKSWVNACSSVLRKQDWNNLSIFVVLNFTWKWLNNKTKLRFQV